MLEFSGDGATVTLILLLITVSATASAEEGVFTNHFLVQLHEQTEDEAHQLATEHGFDSARKVRRRW